MVCAWGAGVAGLFILGIAVAFVPENRLCCVAYPRKVFNLAAVCALHSLLSDTKSASQTQYKQPLPCSW